MNNDYILERISDTLFSSGKLSITIYSLLNDKGNNDGKAYPGTVLSLYNSTKYSNTQTLGELTFGRTGLIMGFNYIDRTANPSIRESVNFGEELMTSDDMLNLVNYEKHIVNNFSQIFIEGVNNTFTINQAAAPYFEIKNNRNMAVSFTPVIVNRIVNNIPVPNPGIRVGIGSYFEDITFNSFQYMVGQVAVYNSHERLAALKDMFKLTTMIMGQYRVSEPRNGGYNQGGGYQNFGQTRGGYNQPNYNGGQFGGGRGQTFNQPQGNFQPNNTYQNPQNNFTNGNFNQPQGMAAGGPFSGNPEDANPNPFSRDAQVAGNGDAAGGASFPRFRRSDSTAAGNLNVDKDATVKTEQTTLDDLSKEVNGDVASAEPVGTEEGSSLNQSILGEIDAMAKEETVDMSDLKDIMDEIE